MTRTYEQRRAELTQADHDMIAIAKRRGRVRLDNGVECTLVAWQPRGNRHKIRVQFDTGGAANIELHRLREVLGDAS